VVCTVCGQELPVEPYEGQIEEWKEKVCGYIAEDVW
jgi:hypothetical protein